MKNISIRKEFKDDYITRAAGERLRTLILASDRANERLKLDFGGLMVASPSFFDEAFAKLKSHDWNREKLDSVVTLVNLHPRDREVFEEMCRNRELL